MNIEPKIMSSHKKEEKNIQKCFKIAGTDGIMIHYIKNQKSRCPSVQVSLDLNVWGPNVPGVQVSPWGTFGPRGHLDPGHLDPKTLGPREFSWFFNS